MPKNLNAAHRGKIQQDLDHLKRSIIQDTLSATLNSGYDYIFAAYDFINAVPRIAVSKKKNSQELLVYPRMNHDDYALWVTESAPANKSMEILKEDVDFSESLGGLYTFSFHTQYMGDKENLKVVEDLVTYP